MWHVEDVVLLTQNEAYCTRLPQLFSEARALGYLARVRDEMDDLQYAMDNAQNCPPEASRKHVDRLMKKMEITDHVRMGLLHILGTEDQL